jgi:hypothetical protein
MSSNRNQYEDRQRTNAALVEGPNGPLAQARPKNWLGESDGSAIIDALLLTGATVDTLVQHSGRSRKAVRAHLRHLRSTHGLIVNEQQGVLSFGINPV